MLLACPVHRFPPAPAFWCTGRKIPHNLYKGLKPAPNFFGLTYTHESKIPGVACNRILVSRQLPPQFCYFYFSVARNERTRAHTHTHLAFVAEACPLRRLRGRHLADSAANEVALPNTLRSNIGRIITREEKKGNRVKKKEKRDNKNIRGRGESTIWAKITFTREYHYITSTCTVREHEIVSH